MDFQTLSSRVDFLISLNKWHTAEKLLATFLEDSSNHIEANLQMASLFVRQSRFSEALASFQKILKYAPSHNEARLGMAACLCDLGLYEDATEILSCGKSPVENSQIGNDAKIKISKELARCAEALGHLDQKEKAGELYEEAFEMSRTIDPNFAVSFSKSCLELEQTEKAKRILQDSEFQHNPGVLRTLGLVYFQKGQLGQAKTHWEKARHIDPDHPLSKAYCAIAERWSFDGER